jgi:hypothetical protein
MKKMKGKVTLQAKKVKKTLLVKKVKDQHEVDVVTPCFPQFVKITGLAKNCGKLRNVNMYYVNNIMNLYCRTAERGCAEKETTMAMEGT